MPENVTHSSSSRPGRILYLDNIRIYLISIVVLHHIALGYSGSGIWTINETPTDRISPFLFFIFISINQSYFLSFFYLVSGYFLPGSFDRKGPRKFLKDRLIRLGIPLLFYIVIIAPLISYLVVTLAMGKDVSFSQIVSVFIKNRKIFVGPLWFVEGLLIFSIIYFLFRIFKDRFIPNVSFNPFENTFPTNWAIVLSIIAIALGTFAVRLKFPVGNIFYHFQLGHFVHYSFCFLLGIIAYRGKWLDNLSDSKGKLWGIVAVITICFLPIAVALSIASGKTPDIFLGGFSWQSFAFSVWESIACLSIIISLLYLFQKKCNQQGRLLKNMTHDVYTVYINHQLVITIIMAFFLHITFPTIAKFILVSLIGLPLCFILSHFVIRKIPYATRVLG